MKYKGFRIEKVPGSIKGGNNQYGESGYRIVFPVPYNSLTHMKDGKELIDGFWDVLNGCLEDESDGKLHIGFYGETPIIENDKYDAEPMDTVPKSTYRHIEL